MGIWLVYHSHNSPKLHAIPPSFFLLVGKILLTGKQRPFSLYSTPMEQIWVKKFGAPPVLVKEKLPDPTPRTGEVRIRVEAIGVNFNDLVARMGAMKNTPPLPFVPGLEVAGVVDIVGQGVPDIHEGDAVFALSHFGAYADTVCVPHYQVFKRLQWMPTQDAAALPFNYLTAYLLVRVLGAVQAGDKVLVHNAGGGVGTAVVDICRIRGAEIFGTASPEKLDYLKQRGVHHGIDYRNLDYERVVRDLTGSKGVDVILDGLGGVHWPKNNRLISPTGRLIYYGTQSTIIGKKQSKLNEWRGKIMVPLYTAFQLIEENKSVSGVNMLGLLDQPHLYRKWMKQIMVWYDEALFRPYVDKTFPLSQAQNAHNYLHDRKNKGKVLLLP